MTADPITRARPEYMAAMAKPHRSGPAFTVYPARKSFRRSVGNLLCTVAGWTGFLALCGFLLSLRVG